MSETPSVISDDKLRALVAGSLPEPEVRNLERLLESDADLRARLDALSGASAFTKEFAPQAVPTSAKSDPAQLTSIITSLKSALPDAGATPSKIESILNPSAQPGMIGRLGPYEVEEHLATGGMGILFKAHDAQLERLVALKVLSPMLANDDKAVTRFLREATAAAAIEHANVLPIYAIDAESADLPFLVMRYVEGPSLEDLMAQHDEPLPFDQILEIARAVTSALVAAHGRNLIHRDLKPSNILVETQSHDECDPGTATPGKNFASIYLTDFGLARSLDSAALTRPGTYLGTPHFSSPEQARGDTCDARSDLFSLGAVFYFMITGRSPFSGEDESATSVIYRVVHEATPSLLRSPHASTPDWFAEVIDRLLQKKPEARYESAADLLTCLENQTSDPSGASARQGSSRKPKLFIAAFALAAIVALVLLRPWAPEAGSEAPDAPGGVFALTSMPGKPGYPSLAEAIDAALPGTVIEIDHDGLLPLNPLTIPAGKRLTIRAADGRHPILVASGLSGPLVRTHSPLVLEGIGFRQNIGRTEDAAAIVLLEPGALLAATHCRFEGSFEGHMRVREAAAHQPILLVKSESPVRLNACELIGKGRVGIRFEAPTENAARSLTLANSLLAGLMAVDASLGSESAPLHLTLDRCSFGGWFGFRVFDDDSPGFPITIRVSDSLFSVRAAVVSTPRSLEEMREHVTWDGRRNVYSSDGFLARAAKKADDPAEGIDNLDDWAHFWSRNEPASLVRFLPFRGTGNSPIGQIPAFDRGLFRLSAELASELPTNGPDLDAIGPGIAYHAWRASEEAVAWRAKARLMNMNENSRDPVSK